ncbi:hypothetical protein BOTBODRAFT_177021 [Botryobasidium botryosum FD-172 SS1]|uniref:BAH domain-containing protein n=1 Tax=Botryobasidium botryosum (strain FD-172 SS1) TaxID=930990 RepID=A0A067MJW5_BOTB1|nr:hypothetical protein BOTBODRAFT_177021 [Botryobasidium botryosum FD-172 SS1]
MLIDTVCQFDYAIINRCRYHASSRSRNISGSLVRVQVDPTGKTWDGELQEIFGFSQDRLGSFIRGKVCWFQRCKQPIPASWHVIALHKTEFWERDLFTKPGEGPGPYIELSSIKSHVARMAAKQGLDAWVTIPLSSH